MTDRLTLRGIALMSVAMLGILLVDSIAKFLSAEYSPLFISWARYAVASAIVLPLAFHRHGRHVFPAEQRGAHLVRTAFLVTAMTLYFLAIARIPLALAVSAYFVGPVIAVVLSALFLRETLTRLKLASLGLGLVGSMVILRPGGTLEPGILLAFGAGLFFALYLIATRQASQTSDPIRTLAFQCVVGTFLLVPQAALTATLPGTDALAFFAALGLLSAIAHILTIMAFRLADASTLAPLVYLELVGAAGVGFLAFGEVPGPATVLGAALIVLAGVILATGRTNGG
ncbi:EamA family transporter [Roseovarius sp. SCSIO 43702]|uniref:DMT family transporter n=1 Tax=Roseovarius sp. SCSIO 43702 TaxID=2823043 RepID=UPI001C73911A|nr:EamA family transporter [Roseovarius sp. SCSIO 43702]QYX57678.1 EamA family transporter [Roseovarius sp. SCSIO 43702]